MFLRIWRLITIMLAALTMGTTVAHALELPAKMNYDATLWTTLQQSLYWGFGNIGGYFEAATVFLAAPVLAFLVRKRRPTFQWTIAGTVCFALAFFVVFLVFTEPMNREIFQWTPQSVPTDWTRVRNQWEYSHVARFVLHLMGLGALLMSVLVEIPITKSVKLDQRCGQKRFWTQCAINCFGKDCGFLTSRTFSATPGLCSISI